MSPAVPCEGAEIVSSTIGLRLRLLRWMMAPAVAMDLPLKVVPSPLIDCFYKVRVRLRGYLRMNLVGKRLECWNSALNESISL